VCVCVTYSYDQGNNPERPQKKRNRMAKNVQPYVFVQIGVQKKIFTRFLPSCAFLPVAKPSPFVAEETRRFRFLWCQQSDGSTFSPVDGWTNRLTPSVVARSRSRSPLILKQGDGGNCLFVRASIAIKK